MTLVVPVVVVRHLHIITIMVVLINVVVVMDMVFVLAKWMIS